MHQRVPHGPRLRARRDPRDRRVDGRAGRGLDPLRRRRAETIATKVYGADGVDYAPAANTSIDLYERNGFGGLPICVAKTHLSISSDPKLLGAPTGWRMPVREVRASVGAGFIYPICGDMRTMPGLGKNPAAHHIDVKPDGTIVGLF
ncbi:MAG: fhs [Actinomycetospora sp.]|nr:fhs [Actinomycetospora sp.]